MAVLLAGEEIEDPAIEEDAAIEETADCGELSKEDTADIDSGSETTVEAWRVAVLLTELLKLGLIIFDCWEAIEDDSKDRTKAERLVKRTGGTAE